jgi:hypothetical protein
MSNNESKELQVVTIKPDAPKEWGDREEVAALSNRFETMLPAAKALRPDHRLALAQYAKVTDANPFRGELYAFVGKGGQPVIVEGYKLLVRWAKRECPYTDKFVEWDDEMKLSRKLKVEDIAFTCYILREDQMSVLQQFIDMKVPFQEAYEHVAFSTSGVLLHEETFSMKSGQKKEYAPPTGWTWHDVAKKRALKNTLNLSHSPPSPTEMIKESWMVDETETTAEDWDPELNGPVAERAALLSAQNRQFQKDSEEFKAGHTPEELKERQEKHVQIMRGDDAIANDIIEPDVLISEVSPEIKEFRELAGKYGLDQTDDRNAVSKWLFNIPIAKLEDTNNELKRWNFLEYLRRASILNQEQDDDGKVVLFKDKIAQIPELKDVEWEESDNANTAKRKLRDEVQKQTENDERLIALDVADDQ